MRVRVYSFINKITIQFIGYVHVFYFFFLIRQDSYRKAASTGKESSAGYCSDETPYHVRGTPDYLAPELLLGLGHGLCSAKCDMYIYINIIYIYK